MFAKRDKERIEAGEGEDAMQRRRRALRSRIDFIV